MPETPEDKARRTIDDLLSKAGWTIQDREIAEDLDAALEQFSQIANDLK